MNLNVIDIETDDLYPYDKNIWTVVIFKPEKGTKLLVHPYKDKDAKQKILNFIFDEEGVPVISGHNILGFDLWSCWRNLDLKFSIKIKHHLENKEVLFLDTLHMSRFLHPDMDGHSLEKWGERLHEKKIDYREKLVEEGLIDRNSPLRFEFSFHNEIMDVYCIQDTVVCSKIFSKLYNEIIDTNQLNQFLVSQYNFFLMSAQSYTGFHFDKQHALELKKEIEKTMTEYKNRLEPTLPSRNLKTAEKSFYTIPKKPYKSDGSFSANMLNFLKRTGAKEVSDGFIEFKGKIYPIKPELLLDVKLPMSLDDQQHMKEFFLKSGWEPTMWNFKKDKKGKLIRDDEFQPIKTSPKLQENGKICPNLLNLSGDLVKEVVKYLSYKNRYSVLCGWLEEKRLEYDGKLSASFSGITPTHRIKHSIIVNVPKAQDDVILGHEFRSLFTSTPGNALIGCDQSALEARCEAHWVARFDIEAAKFLLEGDIHSKNAKVFFPEETKNFDITSSDFDKDAPEFKPYRSLAKNGKYALAYGCTAKKLSKTLRKPESEGKKLYDDFWEANPGLKKLKDSLIREYREQGFLYGIDRRRLNVRSEHSILNLLIQSTGSVVMEIALLLFDIKMGEMFLNKAGSPYYLYKGEYVARVGFFHDEVIVECSPIIQEEIAEILEECMRKSGEFLKMAFPLKGEAKIGKNWKETH